MDINGYAVTPLNILAFYMGFWIHPLMGYLLVDYATDLNPQWGAIGGIIPNLDLAFYVWPHHFPLVHRGIMHTPFFAGILAICIALWSVRASLGILIGYLAELGVDVFESHIGVMLTYPLNTTHYALPIPHMDIWIPAVTVILAILVFAHQETHTRDRVVRVIHRS